MNSPLRKAQQGVVAVLVAGSLVVLLITMGIALYTGITAYIQGDMQHLANSMALAGARSMYDALGDDETTPTVSSGLATTAAQTVFDRVTTYHPILVKYFNVILSAPIVVKEAEQSVQVFLSGTIATPFLSFMGIQQLELQAKSKALYSQANGMVTPIRINTQGVDENGVPIPNHPYAQAVTLPMPLLNGYGADLFIDTGLAPSGGYHGVKVELCTVDNGDGLQCYDMAQAARVYNNEGAIRVIRNAENPTIEVGRVLYGKIFIDMAVLNLNKATAIRISDDGVHDAIAGTNGNGTTTGRFIELVPADTNITSIRLLHYGVLCQEANCVRPNGFMPAPAAY